MILYSTLCHDLRIDLQTVRDAISVHTLKLWIDTRKFELLHQLIEHGWNPEFRFHLCTTRSLSLLNYFPSRPLDENVLDGGLWGKLDNAMTRYISFGKFATHASCYWQFFALPLRYWPQCLPSIDLTTKTISDIWLNIPFSCLALNLLLIFSLIWIAPYVNWTYKWVSISN